MPNFCSYCVLNWQSFQYVRQQCKCNRNLITAIVVLCLKLVAVQLLWPDDAISVLLSLWLLSGNCEKIELFLMTGGRICCQQASISACTFSGNQHHCRNIHVYFMVMQVPLIIFSVSSQVMQLIDTRSYPNTFKLYYKLVFISLTDCTVIPLRCIL
jgi:hypothetical protein